MSNIRSENTLKLTREEALLIIENLPGRKKFYVHSQVKIVNDEPEKLPTRHTMTSIKLTQTQAVQLVRGLLLNDFEADGDRIPIRTIAYNGTLSKKNYTAIWIG